MTRTQLLAKKKKFSRQLRKATAVLNAANRACAKAERMKERLEKKVTWIREELHDRT